MRVITIICVKIYTTNFPLHYLAWEEQEKIRGAFQHWEANTCVRFEEVPISQNLKEHHLLISAHTTGCHSYVGRTSWAAQVINLQSVCLLQVQEQDIQLVKIIYHLMVDWSNQHSFNLNVK